MVECMDKYVEIPNLPQNAVTEILIGEYTELKIPFDSLGINVRFLPENPLIDSKLKKHIDLSLLHLGNKHFISADTISKSIALDGANIQKYSGEISGKYPNDCRLCAVIGNDFIITGNRDLASQNIGKENLRKNFIITKQGYAKCCVAIVDHNSLITSDKGIAKTLKSYKDRFNVLEISQGYFELENFPYGFIGGSCAKISKDILMFTGSIKSHPDYYSIKSFLRNMSIYIETLTGKNAFDIGSMIPIREKID